MTLYIVCEDQLSETVMRKMISVYFPLYNIDIVAFGKRGRGYIQEKIKDFIKQNSLYFFILVDLNSDECAPVLIKKWMNSPLQQNILFRIAVREVESWLLADTTGLSQFLNLSYPLVKKEVNIPDNISHPKEKLISLADRSKKKDIKIDIVRKENSSYKQGSGYNSRLADYVDNYWEIKRAIKLSDSLKRAVNSLAQFTKSFENGKH